MRQPAILITLVDHMQRTGLHIVITTEQNPKDFLHFIGGCGMPEPSTSRYAYVSVGEAIAVATISVGTEKAINMVIAEMPAIKEAAEKWIKEFNQPTPPCTDCRKDPKEIREP